MKRPAIPESVKRIVRQKCGFGCIFCGNMICDYEHIKNYSLNPCHEADNIVLLCQTHHREVTSGRKSKELVLRAAQNPYSKTPQGQGANYRFDTYQSPIDIELGGNIYAFQPGDPGANLVVFEENPIFSVHLDEGFPQFSFIMCGIKENELLRVERNEVTVQSGLWDVELAGRYLRVRYGQGQVAAKIRLDQSKIKFEKLLLVHKGFCIIFLNKETIIPGSTGIDAHMNGNLYTNFCGEFINIISIGDNTKNRSFFRCGKQDESAGITENDIIKYMKIKSSLKSNLDGKYGPYGSYPIRK